MGSFNLDERENARAFALRIHELENRLNALERTNQLVGASIEGGSLDIYDDEGTLRAQLGMQEDGTAAMVPVNSTPPPVPTAPVVEAVLAGLLVGWDGQWADADASPSDFSLVQVHVGPSAEFVPDLSTLVATVTAPMGGTVTIAIEGYAPVWVRLVAANTAALTGEPSTATAGTPRQAVPTDLTDGIITDTKLAQSAVTAAKIALGAVGSTALASGAVLADKLSKAAVTLDKIAQGAVTMNALGGTLADGITQRYVDAMGDPAAWLVLSKAAGGSWDHLSGVADAPTGQSVAQATRYAVVRGTVQVPYDPEVLYRISVRVRTTAPSAAGTDTLYVGALGIAANGVTLVSRSGANTYTSAHYVAASNASLPSTAGWVTYVGYLKGRAAAGAQGTGGQAGDPRSPGVMHADTRFIAPILYLNFASGPTGTTGVMQVDAVTIEALKTGVVDGTNLVVGSVATAHLATDAVTAGKIAADAVTAGKVAADAISAREIQANSVTAVELAAGSVTTDKLTVTGGSNILPDPSFEGLLTATLVAGLSYATQDKTRGNGSPSSIKLDGRSATPVYRDVPLTLIPALPGDQFYLACDYYLSADWAGNSANFMARWEDATGASLGYGVVGSEAAPVREAWARASGTVTAPAGTVRASIRLENANTTAGDAWFDNAALRPVVPGVQIADGAITAPKILAGAVTTDKLLALAVTAEKIASLAITTDKLSALAVTADKLAANSVTATKILAGAIEATHIKAGSLTADRLALGTDGNVISDPSFEGAVSDQRVSGNTYWSIVTPGNGTPRALQVNAANATAVIRSMTLATLPAVPGQKVWLGIDYLASTDWNGLRISFYAQWLDAAGNILGYSTVTTGDAAVKGSWQRLTDVPTAAAPTGTTQVRVACSTVDSTAGTVQYDNASCRIVLASGVAGARAEISPQGLTLFDDGGDEAVALMTGRPNYLTLNADGLPVATIDQEGKAGFQALAIAEGLTVGGDDIAQIIDRGPRGIIAYGVPTATVTATGTEIGFYELPVTIVAGRMYRISFQAVADFDNAHDGEGRIHLRDGGPATPTISSVLRQAAIRTPAQTGRYWTAELEHIFPASAVGAGLHRFLISFYNEGGSAGQTMELGLTTTGRSCYFAVEDIGAEVPKTGGPNTGGGTSDPPLVQYTKTYSATWSGSYSSRGSYNSNYGNSCYQGYYSSTNGMQASLIGFSSALGTDLSGATIQKAEVYLYFDHWYSNLGGKAVIKAHSHTSRPGTFSCDAESKTVTWSKSEGKWVDITSVFDSTKWRGVALDPNTSGLTYYGRARGYGQTNPPKLRVTYTK